MQASGVEVRLELRKVNVVESLDRFECHLHGSVVDTFQKPRT